MMPHLESGTPARRALVTLTVGDQLCGIDVARVRDVLGPREVTPVPLAPPAVTGLLNLRGQIVTAIDLRRRLGLADNVAGRDGMHVVVEQGGALYALAADSVGEVLRLPVQSFERSPAVVDARWRGLCEAVCRVGDRLLVLLDGDSVIDCATEAAA